jgi:hypothetical protein
MHKVINVSTRYRELEVKSFLRGKELRVQVKSAACVYQMSREILGNSKRKNIRVLDGTINKTLNKDVELIL